MGKKLLFLFIILYISAAAQAPDWEWAKKMDGSGFEFITNITTDAKNNLYAFGSFTSPTLTLDNITLNKRYPMDFFMAKYKANGELLWAKTPFDAPEGMSSFTMDSITGHVYGSGHFTNQLVLGNDTLKSIEPSAFVAKYDSLGNYLWARSISGVTFYSTSESVDEKSNLYVTGAFKGPHFVFNNDTLVRYTDNDPKVNRAFTIKLSASGKLLWYKTTSLAGHLMPKNILARQNAIYSSGVFGWDTLFIDNHILLPSGEPDTYLVKYDSLGNVLWTKTISGDREEDSPKISINKEGDLYFTQTSYSTKINVDGVLTPFVPGSVFVSKFNPSGKVIWTKIIETPAGRISVYDHISDQNNNLYLSGLYAWFSLVFACDTLKSSSTYGHLFILKYDANGVPSWLLGSDNINEEEDIVSALTCDRNNNIYAAGEFQSPSLKLGKINFINSGVKTYEAFLTRLNKCSPLSPAIYMVSVDSLSRNNVIVWDNAFYTNVDSFIVYREIGTNDFRPIASIPYGADGKFVDTVRTKYFPNTGNPNAGSSRYKIQALDSCGNYSMLSTYHNTIFITSNKNGNFSWPQPYAIENTVNPVRSYVLMRDDLSNNNWHPVASVSGTQQAITDPDFKSWEKTASWRIETNWNISCAVYPKTRTASLSNILRFHTTAIRDEERTNKIVVFPNPGKGSFSIESSDPLVRIEIVNVLGEIVYVKSVNTFSEKVDISHQSNGIYSIRIQTVKGMSVKKFMLQQ